MCFPPSIVLAIGLLACGDSPQGPAPSSAPLTVEQAVSEALAGNPEMLADRIAVDVAEAGVRTATLWPNPALSFSADHLDLAGTPFTEENGAGPSEYSLRADWPFAFSSTRKNRRLAAERARDLAAGTAADRSRLLRFEVQEAFTNLVLAQRLVGLVRENIDGMRQVLRMNESRVKAGDLAEVELLRIRVAVRQLENEADVADLGRRSAARRLQLLTGRPADGPLPEAVGEFAPRIAAPDGAELFALALTARPDLRAARADLARADAEAGLQQSLKRPELGLGAEFRRQDGVNGHGSSLGFFISTPLPFFDRNQGEIARAGAETRQAALRVRALQAAIQSDVQLALDRLTTAGALLERLEGDQSGDARQVREIVGYAYERGEASLIELLDARRAFNDAAWAFLEARAEYARARYLVEAVSGEDRQP